MRTRFADELNRFTKAGKAVVGICNGFQILIESGLLPDGSIEPERDKKFSLVNNSNNRFEWGWSKLKINDSVCRYVGEDLVGATIELPFAHQEGRLAARDHFDIEDLEDDGQVVFNYVGETGIETEEYPENPNGSPHGITGICDPSGVVLGLMPHPERAVLPTQLRNWRRHDNQPPYGEIFFKSIVEYAKTS
jgi:phosphoribosylformylglycinamidine synthase